MAFQLRIARGHQEGRSYLIGQARVRVGALEGNDVVLSDAGVSGLHLQIIEREGRYFVSDLSSANGTWLNGEPVQAERELKTGDALAVGSALLSFVMVEGDKQMPLVPVETRDATRPENVKHTVKRQELVTVPERVGKKPFADDDATAPVADALPAPRAPLVDPETTAPEARPLGAVMPVAEKTGTAEAVEPSSPSINSLLLDDSSKESSGGSLPPLEISRSELVALREEAELADASPVPRSRPPVPSSPPPVAEPSQPSGHSLSVTPVDDPTKDERFGRHTDALSMPYRRGGWLAGLEDLPGWVRIGGAALVGLLVVLAAAMIIHTVRASNEAVLPPEPAELSKDPIAFSFGVGPKVDFEQPDQKQLTFEVPASPPYLVLVHYEAQDIDKQEVEILVNNVSAGFVPADTGIEDRQLEVVLGPDVLKPGEKNVLMFDNLKNPPGHEAWRVSRLSYQLVLATVLDAAGAVKAAQQKVDAGNALYSAQKAAPDNLLKAWLAFREAYFGLVGVGSAPARTLSTASRLKYEEAGLQLDRECARLLTEAAKRMDDKLPQEAKKALDQIDAEFTSDEHRCRGLASERRDEYLLR